MKRLCMISLFLCLQTSVVLAETANTQSIVDAINADLLAVQVEDATMEERKITNQKSREAGCLLKGILVADLVVRKQAGETVDSAYEAVLADPAYELLPQRELMEMLAKTVFQYFGTMTPEAAKDFTIVECNKT